MLAPASTVTAAGTLATRGLLLESPTTMPPAGAADCRLTVPVAEAPPVTGEGFTLDSGQKGG